MNPGEARTPPSGPRNRRIALYLLLIPLGALPLLWPGDTPWIDDEPRLVLQAARNNRAGSPAVLGIPTASRGIRYGPLPTWIYSSLLRLCDDLIGLVRLRALLVTILTALSIAWLARLCPDLDPPLGTLALLSPYLWLYSRQLWDNTFLIPLSSLTLTAYLSFCGAPRFWKIAMAGAGAAGMGLTHPMSAALIAPLLVHALFFHGRWFLLRRFSVGALSLALAGVSWPYLSYLLASLSALQGRPGPLSAWAGWTFPLSGGRFFSALGLEYFLGSRWTNSAVLGSSPWLPAAAIWTYAALPLSWAGLLLCVRRISTPPPSGRRPDPARHMSLLCLAAMACQCALDGTLRAYGHPHYHNATWFCHFYFLWSALSRRPSCRVPAILAALGRASYSLALACVLGFLIVNLHVSGGNQEVRYGPTLENQIWIARFLHRYRPDSPVVGEVLSYRLFPHALDALRELYGLRGTPSGPRRKLRIRPVFDDSRLGWLIAQEIQTP